MSRDSLRRILAEQYNAGPECRREAALVVPYIFARPSNENATLPYVLQLTNKGYRQALKESPALLKRLNIIGAKVMHRKVAEAFGLEYRAGESPIG